MHAGTPIYLLDSRTGEDSHARDNARWMWVLVAQLTHTGAGAQPSRRAARRPHLPGSGRGRCKALAAVSCAVAAPLQDRPRTPEKSPLFLPCHPPPRIAAPASDAIAGLVAAATPTTAATIAMALEAAPGPTSGLLPPRHRHHNAAWRAATDSPASGTGKCTNKLNRRRATMAR